MDYFPPLLQLPTDILILIIGISSSKMKDYNLLKQVCHFFKDLLNRNDTWLSLVHYAFSIDEKKRKLEWPLIESTQFLYSVLERYARLEGYYVLDTAFPWGILVQFRFLKGQFVAEAFNLKPTSQEKNLILYVDFSNSSKATTCCDFEIPSGIQEIKPVQFIDKSVFLPWVSKVFFSPSTTLTVSLVAEPSALIGANSWTMGVISNDRSNPALFWDIQNLLRSQTSLQFRQVSSPNHLTWFHPTEEHYKLGLPRLQQGLYTANYQPKIYGHFSQEVLLLSFYSFNPQDEESYTIACQDIYRLDKTTLANRLLKAYGEFYLLEEIVILVGRKVTGDVHVPMGAVSFTAFVFPPTQETSSVPTTVRVDKEDHCHVLRGWPGLGTLSFYGFTHPSWAEAFVLQLENTQSSDPVFGVHWVNRPSERVIQLRWLESQNDHPFLNCSSLYESQSDPQRIPKPRKRKRRIPDLGFYVT